MKKLLSIAVVVLFAGCASNSGIVPAGSGTFNITKQQGTGFPGLGSMKAEAYAEAAAHCNLQKRDFAVVNYEETKGPYILGNYPRVDLVFRCL